MRQPVCMPDLLEGFMVMRCTGQLAPWTRQLAELMAPWSSDICAGASASAALFPSRAATRRILFLQFY